MGCKDCEAISEKQIFIIITGTYYPFRNTRIAIVACAAHAKEVKEALDYYQKQFPIRPPGTNEKRFDGPGADL